MTLREIAEEMSYRREERLGILCQDFEPYPEELKEAREDAWKWLILTRQSNQQENT